MERRVMRWSILGAILISALWVTAGWAAKPRLIRKLSGTKSRSAERATVAIQWQPDLKAAHRVSQQTGRPMLIVVCGPNCAPCRQLVNETLTEASLATYINTAFVPVHLDYQRDNRAAKILEVQALPTCVVLTSEADLLGTIEGYVRPSEFTSTLHQSLDYQRTLQASAAAAEEP